MKPYLHTKDVADLLGVSEGTVRFWRHAGTGPLGFRIGRRVVYRHEAIDTWVAEREAAERRPA